MQTQLEIVQLNKMQQFIFNLINQSELSRTNLISLINFRRIITALKQLSFQNNEFNERLIAQVRFDLLNQFSRFPQ